MEIKTLKRNNKKKLLIGGVIVTTALTVGILETSYSKYRITENIKLGNGMINYSNHDLDLVGMYLINEDNSETKIDTVPGDGYTLNEEKTKCTVNNIEINASIEYKDNKLYFGDITEKDTKCKVYFEHKPSASSTIIAGNNPKPGTDSFTNGATTAADSGLFSTTDDDGTTYYYRGIHANVNNWVDFAGFKWRIIRINGDGSIRIIYNGTTYSTTGSGTQIGTNAFNNTGNHNKYVGYMYGESSNDYAITHTNTNSSTIKGVLDNWYKTNIIDNNYDKYISKEAGFCGDRQVATGHSNYTGNGGGTSKTVYAPANRLMSTNLTEGKTTQTPTYSCNTNDLYTISTSSKGNHALTYPIGLITSDEIVYAGGFGNSANKVYWLYNNEYQWSMSPFRYFIYNINSQYAGMFCIGNDGGLYLEDGHRSSGIRPVINLRSDIELTGSGTTTDPYKIVK